MLEVQGIPVPGGGFITTYMDITARHIAEQQRRDSEQQARRKSAMLEVTLAHISQGLSMYDADGRLMVWNDRFVELYRLPPELQQEGVSYKAIVKYLPQIGVLKTDQPDWRQRVAAGETVVAQLDFDDERAIKIVYQPIPGSGWVATHEDITERLRVKIELSQQAERLARMNMQFDAALTNMSQGLAMLDSEGKLVLTNKRFQEMYGLDEEQLKPGTPAQDIVARYVPRFATSEMTVKNYLARLSQDVDSVIPLADGRIMRIRRALTSDGGWVATHEDITAQERSAQQISYLAFHDGLTELANRAELNKQGKLALDAGKQPISVLLIDLDRFKAVNDTFGHAAGDRLLQQVALRMRDAGRPERSGGAGRRRRIRAAAGALRRPARSRDCAGVAADRGVAPALRPRRQAGIDRRQHRHRGALAADGAVRRSDPPSRPRALRDQIRRTQRLSAVRRQPRRAGA